MMQDDNGVCVHHEHFCKQITETLNIVRRIEVKLMGTMDVKGMIAEHRELYDAFIESKETKSGIGKQAIGYLVTSIMGGLIVLIVLGVKAMF